MTRIRNLPALVVGALLIGSIVISYLTRESSTVPLAIRKPAPESQISSVDQRLLLTARRLAAVADSSDERDLVREALHLSDDELDLAFVTALREAAVPAPPPSGPLKQLSDHIADLKSRIADEQARIAKLTKAGDAAASQLELVKAQLALDQDELGDAQQDLAEQGGDPRTKIQRALEEHEAAHQQLAQLPASAGPAHPATLAGQVSLWIVLSGRENEIEKAGQQATAHAALLAREHAALETKTNTSAAQHAAPIASDDTAEETEDEEDTATIVARLRRLSDQAKTLADLDKRAADSKQLADVYKRWVAALDARERAVWHSLAGSLSLVFGIVLAVMLVNQAIRRTFAAKTDRKRLHQLRVVSTIAIQVAGVLLIVLVVFGAPTQATTIIGLTTAGLTVALKDFIVAFFGWFALLGRNGLRVGDWVEIEGVSGEVIEIGVVKTVLLEMGNWATTGHPTGRRVSFVNSFAIEGHYFNFSTAGQWLWDELQLALPLSGDPYQMAHEIRQLAERETAAETTQAEQDWERVTHQYGMRPFSAKPAVEIRPSREGLNLVVRYITRAPQRYEVKSRLFEAIVGLMHKPAEGAGKL